MTLKSSTPVDTIIFDLGAVLIDWNPEYLYRKIFKKEAEMHHFLSNICTPDWNAEQDAGRTWAEATQLLINRHPDFTDEILAYWKRWPEMLKGPVQGTLEILKKIRKQDKYRLLALTNWSAETWPVAWEQYDFLRWFEGILVSGQEAVKKPDKQIFQLLIDRYEVQPAKALFIDDSKANIETAREVGLWAIHFTSPESLARELQQARII